MTLEEIGHNKRVKVTRHSNYHGSRFIDAYEAEGLLVLDTWGGWYLLTNNSDWDGDRCHLVRGMGYKYSWVLGFEQYDTVSPLESMYIRKNIKKHKMVDMT